MLNKPYMDRFYTYHSKYISNALALRPPQHDCLEILARLCDLLTLKKDADLQQELLAVQTLCPTLSSFERDFPSICFSLATGIGKTRLMGACIAYLHYVKGIKHFFVMAPNLTIYKKLRDDLGSPASKKYVFRGLDKFVTPPRIIDADNYEEFRQTSFDSNEIIINVFNISKLNADSKSKDGKPARIKRLNEVLGESYFSYLQNLPDLCIFMDESHHYRAEKSFEVINELRPILGVELTATPQVQKGTKKALFKNVVYEYSLAHALNDGQYVKIPAVLTRKNFCPEEYTSDQLDREKLNDGLRIHEDTKSHLDIYARTYGKPIIKPFVLVVAKDTEHSRKIRDYLTSDEFFRGDYKDKVLEINSNQRGAEKDENILQLLSLERPENKIEIVIHVNMLKEGWDVTNLYTIIPLRASASETLTEQTIGRGLRLPYGNRTGVAEVDRLSIVSHDKYEAIVKLANEPESLVRKVYYIDDVVPPTDEPRETVPMPSAYDAATSDESFTIQLADLLKEQAPAPAIEREERTTEQNQKIATFIAKVSASTVKELNKQVKTFDAVKDPETRKFVEQTVAKQVVQNFPEYKLRTEDILPAVQKAVQTCTQTLTDKVIPIPQTVVQPFAEVKQGYYPFTLDTRNMNWHASEDALIGTELQADGETFEYDPKVFAQYPVDTPENEIVRHLIVRDDIDYQATADLLYSLIGDAKKHFLTYLTTEETEKVMRARQKTIADLIYQQMRQHFFREETSYRASEIRPFSHIELSFGNKFTSDEIYDLRATIAAGEVRQKIFNGFKKACHTLYKFDSNSERLFAIVLENDKDVLKWLRPAKKQFHLYYGAGGMHEYEPDFIVETAAEIYMVEIKASKDLTADNVLDKANAGMSYCQAASEWNAQNGGKPWKYALISHDEVRLNSGFRYLIQNRVPDEQFRLST